MCKLWMVMIRKIGARPSKHPKLHCPHLHPLKVENMNVASFFGPVVAQIAEDAMAIFQKDATLEMPDAIKN